MIATKSLAQRIHQGRLARAHWPAHTHGESPLQIVPLQGLFARIKGSRGFQGFVGMAVLAMAVTMMMRVGVVVGVPVRVGVRAIFGSILLLLAVIVVVMMGVMRNVVAVRMRVSLSMVFMAVGVAVAVLARVVMVHMLPVPCKGRIRDQKEESKGRDSEITICLSPRVTYRDDDGGGPPRLSRVWEEGKRWVEDEAERIRMPRHPTSHAAHTSKSM
jgi:hypothetical protein